jgi:hypothetical protein
MKEPKVTKNKMKNRISRTYPLIKTNGLKAAGAFVGLMVGGGMAVYAQSDTDTNAIANLEKQNQMLQQRLDALEDLAKKEGLMPSGDPPKHVVSGMGDMTISGFVQASYFYNTQHPASGQSAGYLWNTKDNSFSLNKFKLTVAGAPVATDKWDATYRASLLFGDDAPDLNSSGANGTGSNTSFNDLREAYVELNVPIGTGLDIKAGELISLLNWESGDGGAANPNFSQGLQWWYTGNGPSAGVQGTYNFTDKVGLTLRVDNGLFQGPVDNNQGKAFSGSVNFKPNDKLWFNIVGWYDSQPGDSTTSGIESIGGYQFTKKLGTGYEVDYFHFSAPTASTDLWSLGGWAWYNFTDKVGVAFRADYVSQDNGLLGPAVRPGAALTSINNGGDLGSLTATLNLTPVPNIKIQPEIRYDYTSYYKGLNGDVARFIIGCGATYNF